MNWRYLLPVGAILFIFSGGIFRTMLGVIGMVFIALGLFDFIVNFLRKETEDQEKASKKK